MVGAAVFFDEVVGEFEDVALALAQRRHVDGEDIEPVVEILPEFGGFDHLFEVAVGRGDDADIDRDRAAAADALDFALLEDAEEFDLRGGGEVADLVEEDRAAVGQFEATLAHRDGAGEGPLLVAEEFAFEDRLGEGGAVDLDEGLVGAEAVVVDRVGDQFLAGAALAADQDGGVALADLGDEVVDVLHDVGVADDVGRAEAILEFLLEALVFGEEAFAFLAERLAEADGLGDHRADDLEQAEVFVERDAALGEAVDAERTVDLLALFDRDAEEADGFAVAPAAGAGAVEEFGFGVDVGDDHRAAGFDDLAGDAFAELVAAAFLLAVGEAVGGLDHHLAGVAVEQGEGAARHAHVVGDGNEDLLDDLAQVDGGVEDLADFEEEGEFADLAAD
ncbi:MAG: hypothetical protein BWZ08_02381 [candidate division BRC1 bacterium ADurb.BinA292]|nr:MAG: hypothetical protein BWZ08_02381 [candidate division BRC1 bacterium ADurb.BinA292]